MWRTSSRCSSVVTFLCRISASRIWLPMVWTGDSDDIGSWKIMPMRLPRSARISGPSRRSVARSTGTPGLLGSVNRMRPPSTRPFRGRRPMTVWEMTVLPDPDSPTRATVLPAGTRNVTPETTSAAPPCMAKPTLKSSILRMSGGGVGAGVVGMERSWKPMLQTMICHAA